MSLTLGDNGIITQAEKAKEAQEIAAIKEDFQLAILDKELEKGGTGLTKEELEEIAGNYGELQEDGNTIKTDEGYEIKIDEIYKPGGGTGGDAATDEEIAALEEKIKELEQTVEDLTNTKTELEGTIEDLNGQLEQAGEDKTALEEQIENLQGQVDTLNKTIEQQESTINDLNTQIASLKEKQSKGTAIASDVLEGKTFSNSSDIEIPGTMKNRGAINQSLNAGGSYTIPAGYHNGSGKITVNSLASQTSANAGAGQILSGYTAWVNGNKITGSMANKGNLNWSGSNTTYNVPAGYYSGGTLDSRPSYTNGYNAGVSAADNRVNTNSTNYKSGYNAGVSAGKNAGWSSKTINTTGSGSGNNLGCTFYRGSNGPYNGNAVWIQFNTGVSRILALRVAIYAGGEWESTLTWQAGYPNRVSHIRGNSKNGAGAEILIGSGTNFWINNTNAKLPICYNNQTHYYGKSCSVQIWYY